MRRVAEVLRSQAGRITVTGHTDSVQSRSLQFPSNWHLSEARAATVRELLAAAGVPAARLQARGAGDSAPVAANDSPAGRARNRRVEIELRTGAGS